MFHWRRRSATDMGRPPHPEGQAIGGSWRGLELAEPKAITFFKMARGWPVQRVNHVWLEAKVDRSWMRVSTRSWAPGIQMGSQHTNVRVDQLLQVSLDLVCMTPDSTLDPILGGLTPSRPRSTVPPAPPRSSPSATAGSCSCWSAITLLVSRSC